MCVNSLNPFLQLPKNSNQAILRPSKSFCFFQGWSRLNLKLLTIQKKKKSCLKKETQEKIVCDSVLFERTKATENVLFSEWTIYIAQKWFHVCLLPFPSQRVHMIASRVNVFVSWMRGAIIANLRLTFSLYTLLVSCFCSE